MTYQLITQPDSQVDQGFQAHFKVISKLSEAIAPLSVTFGGSQVLKGHLPRGSPKP